MKNKLLALIVWLMVAVYMSAQTTPGLAGPISAPIVGTDSTGKIILSSPGTPNAQTSTYQVLADDFAGRKTIVVASGTFTITLVASGSQPATGQYIDVINYGSGVVTIARSGQNINGGTGSITLNAASATAPSSAHVLSDATNYFAEVTNPGGTTPTGGGTDWLFGPMISGGEFNPLFGANHAGGWWPFTAKAPTMKGIGLYLSTAPASNETLIAGVFTITSGLPAGSALCSGAVALTSGSTLGKTAITFGSQCSSLVMGQVYAIVLAGDLDAGLNVAGVYNALPAHPTLLNVQSAHLADSSTGVTSGTAGSTVFTSPSGWTSYGGLNDTKIPLLSFFN